jgi:hypothetical protein
MDVSVVSALSVTDNTDPTDNLVTCVLAAYYEGQIKK